MSSRRNYHRWQTISQMPSIQNHGGMNSGICKVRDIFTGQICIEKRLAPTLIATGRARLEISALKTLIGHPSINQLVDWYIDHNLRQGSLFLEYCNHGSLEGYIEESKREQQMISEKLIWKWFLQIASALSFCHYGPNPENAQARSRHNTVCHRVNICSTDMPKPVLTNLF